MILEIDDETATCTVLGATERSRLPYPPDEVWIKVSHQGCQKMALTAKALVEVYRRVFGGLFYEHFPQGETFIMRFRYGKYIVDLYCKDILFIDNDQGEPYEAQVYYDSIPPPRTTGVRRRLIPRPR